MTVNMTSTQKFNATFKVLNAAGKPALYDGEPIWSVSDPAGLRLEIAPDKKSAVVLAQGPEGNYSVKVELDADTGPESRLISATLDVVIGTAPEGEAVSIEFTAPAVEEQDPTTPPASARNRK